MYLWEYDTLNPTRLLFPKPSKTKEVRGFKAPPCCFIVCFCLGVSFCGVVVVAAPAAAV